MIETRNNTLHLDTLLEFEACTRALRNALKHSRFDVITERSIDREIQRSLGVPMKRVLLFTIWDPMQLYQALLTEEDASLLASLNVVVSEKEGGSTITAQSEPLTEASAGSLAMKLLVRSLAEEMTHVLGRVTEQEQSVPKSGWGPRIWNWLKGGERPDYCAKVGGTK
jgi:uncharacterized protein (DUF302 family)